MAVPAVVGADGIRIDSTARTVDFGSTVLREGDVITIDGESGAVELGAVAVEDGETDEIAELLAWMDEIMESEGVSEARA
jgi:pyruvate,orthophosphate dikinase